jgi:UDP:flavonoid glycosyltransferase YjiC (YdhE family)
MPAGADLLSTGLIFEQPVANVAERYDIPLATLHFLPVRAHAQRRESGLLKATGPLSRRIAARGSLEIQAYDEVCFPGLAAEWAKWNAGGPLLAC